MPLPESLLDLILEQHVLHRRQDGERLPRSAELYVKRLPGLAAGSRLNLYAGHLPAYPLDRVTQGTANDPHLFFLLSRAKHIAKRERLVIWFNVLVEGGPGCSSFDGALMEIGPLRVGPRGKELYEVEHSWNEYADLLFIDQPAGTGYSYINHGTPVGELGPAANQVTEFMHNFYTVFPEFTRTETYLAGESYAGMYLPYIAQSVLKSALISAPLKGILMGNAWFDPAIQYPAYLQYAYHTGILTKGSKKASKAEELDKRCNATLHSDEGKDKVLVPSCEALVGAVLPDPKEVDGQSMCLSSYDIHELTPCNAEYPSQVTRVRPYLSAPAVKQAFHASAKPGSWVQCNDTIAQQMWSPSSKPSVELLPSLLEQLDILMYAGEYDLMCNWLGMEESISSLEWAGGRGFGNTTALEWSVNGTKVGSWQSARGLTWVRYTQASHMVPIDKPIETLDMLNRFLGIDKIGLSAAGSAAIIPSRLGGEVEAIIGPTTPEGETIQFVDPEESAQNQKLDPEEQEALDQIQAVANEQSREAFYGPRRSAVLSLLILTCLLGVSYLVRFLSSRHRAYHRRRHQRRLRHEGDRNGKSKHVDLEMEGLMSDVKS